jgi:predicted nuclease with TOPRIM domain
MEGENFADRLCKLEGRVSSLEKLQKHEADCAVGQIGALQDEFDELEEKVEKIGTQVEHQSFLVSRISKADLLG